MNTHKSQILACCLAVAIVSAGCSGEQDRSDAGGNGVDTATDLTSDLGLDLARVDGVAPGDLRGSDQIRNPDTVFADLHETTDPVPQGVDYVILSAGAFVEAAQDLKAYREGMGHVVLLKSVKELAQTGADDEEVVQAARAWLQELYEGRDKSKPFYLALVGDAVQTGADLQYQVPVGYWPGLWQDCYSDNFYGDLDDDHSAEIAVGRIPVATVGEFESFMQRMKQYEQETLVGPWNHRFNVYAGEGGFGAEQDKAIEMVAQKGLETVPYEFDLQFAYKSPSSKYFYAPFENIVEKMITEGSVLVTYMGHGGGELDVPNLSALACKNRMPLCAFFACSTGDFPAGYDSDAEQAFRLPNGPVAMLVSTATTHPYANAINALEMEAAVFADRPETFGEAIRLMKWRSLNGKGELRELLDALAVLHMPAEEMAQSNIDHLYSYNLLGDPAIRLMLPGQGVTLSGPDASRGQKWAFSGTVEAPAQGKAHVAIVCGRAGLLYPLEPVGDPEDPANQSVVQSNWNKAMDHVVGEVEVTVKDGVFSGEIEIPAKTSPGTFHAYVYVSDESSNKDATGSIELKIKNAQ